MIARHVIAEGDEVERVAAAIVDGLRAPDLRCAFVFADWRLDSRVIAGVGRSLAPAHVVGGTTIGVIGPTLPKTPGMAAVGLGLYGDQLRFGVGIANELSKSALTRSRDAVQAAAAALGTTVEKLDPARHWGVVLVDGKCGHEEACCIGSAAAAPQIRFVGGSAASDPMDAASRPRVWANGEAMTDTGIVVLIDSALPCRTVQSQHLVPTEFKTVVTTASGRDITELDGYPAATRLAELADKTGGTLSPRPQISFARYVDGQPYVRSITHIDGEHVHVASAVEAGHVLRIMRPGDLIGQTTKDLEATAEQVGGMSAFLAFSCIGRHWEAQARGIERDLLETYAKYPTVGFQSFGEQSGMLLCNHTLTGLVIGKPKLVGQ